MASPGMSWDCQILCHRGWLGDGKSRDVLHGTVRVTLVYEDICHRGGWVDGKSWDVPELQIERLTGLGMTDVPR